MVKTRYLATAGLLVTILGAPDAAWSQAGAAALLEAKSIKCEFPVMATGTWAKDGTPSAEVKAAKRPVAFSSIDTQGGTAIADGAFGTQPIIVQVSGKYLHFMQIDTSGFLYVTTVFDSLSRPGRHKAVHTRHEFTDIALPGYTSRPEQYLGECEVTR